MKRENIIFCFVLRVCTNRWTKKRFEYANVEVVSVATVTTHNEFICLDYDIEDINNPTTKKRIEETLKFSSTKLAENRIKVESVLEVVAVTSKAKNQSLFKTIMELKEEQKVTAPKKKARTVRKRKIVNIDNQQAMIF